MVHLHSGSEAEKAYILVIDDDPLLTSTLKRVLKKSGYVVEIARDGYEGIQKAKSGFFHLVLCDIKMPGLNGLMTLKHIKEFQEKAGVGTSGLVVITAFDSTEHRQQAFQLGVTDFLTKPFDLNRFLETIDHHVRPLVRETPIQEVRRLNEKLERLLAQAEEK